MVWLSSHGKTLADGAGTVYRMIGVSQDITERKRQEEEARFLAYHDTLTGLPNRRLLDDRLRQAVFLAQRRDARVAVMVVDLDRFKQVNDALGHRAGDAVLREAAHRIAGCVRKADTLARHGGDEFVVVIPDLHQDGDCQVVAEKILRALEPPFRVDGREFTIGASIGVSLFPADAGDGEALLRNADVAMYRAKQLGPQQLPVLRPLKPGSRTTFRGVTTVLRVECRHAACAAPGAFRRSLPPENRGRAVRAGGRCRLRAGARPGPEARGGPRLRQRQPGTAQRGAGGDDRRRRAALGWRPSCAST